VQSVSKRCAYDEPEGSATCWSLRHELAYYMRKLIQPSQGNITNTTNSTSPYTVIGSEFVKHSIVTYLGRLGHVETRILYNCFSTSF
jgi:hypothetical protein